MQSFPLVTGLLSHSDTAAIEEILSFWIGDPAREADALVAKFQRWFQGGDTIDRLIRRRFGALVTAGLQGELDHWGASLRGKLALVILFDQFTRNLFRNTPHAYVGDPRALALALDVVGTGAWRLGATEHRLAFMMPLVHSEDVRLHGLAMTLSREMVDDAPASLRGPLEAGHEHVVRYHSIISRFGRFPHRNAILGRMTTLEENAYLEAEALRT